MARSYNAVFNMQDISCMGIYYLYTHKHSMPEYIFDKYEKDVSFFTLKVPLVGMVL